jgi:hypothetical protein
MGSWGTGIFDCDAACDVLNRLEDAATTRLVIASLVDNESLREAVAEAPATKEFVEKTVAEALSKREVLEKVVERALTGSSFLPEVLIGELTYKATPQEVIVASLASKYPYEVIAAASVVLAAKNGTWSNLKFDPDVSPTATNSLQQEMVDPALVSAVSAIDLTALIGPGTDTYESWFDPAAAAAYLGNVEAIQRELAVCVAGLSR